MYGQDHTWVGWFEDLDRTGTNLDRPAPNDARALAVAEQDDIVVYDLARFTRTVPEASPGCRRWLAQACRSSPRRSRSTPRRPTASCP